MTHLTKRITRTLSFLLMTPLLLGLYLDIAPSLAAQSAVPGLPFMEDFSDTSLRDEDLTNATWSTEEGTLYLAWRQQQYGSFRVGLNGGDITSDDHDTTSVALGDVDGDSDLDLVVGNYFGQANVLYLNNSTADPFNGVSGSDITSDSHDTYSVVLGDVDGDGDLDLVVGNYVSQANRLYLNNGTADPFNDVSGSDITSDAHNTLSVSLGDVDGDGDLDLVVGNYGQANVLYLNNGTTTPFNGVSGSDITDDVNNTRSVALGDVDGDGDLDVVAGNNSQTNRLYLNNGTSDPFNGVSGSDITSDVHDTKSVALGDMDRDGDLDVVAGNGSQANRLYLNNGTADPFNGVSGSDITSDAHDTRSVALGDVDGDGDLDLVAGNYDIQYNLLYLNNGTADPFNGVSGIDITSDAHNTYSVVLGDVDGDGDLDPAAGNFGQPNRLYLNNGTADPFNYVSGVDITSDVYNTSSVALGDMDGDGDLDLVDGYYGINRLYLNNGSTDPFNSVTGSDISSDAHKTISIGLGDMDGDGDIDLVAGNNAQINRLYLNNGTADPFSGVTGSDICSDVDNTYFITLGDVDSDGDLDLVEGNYNQTNRLYLNNGSADPFSGVTGSDISSDLNYTFSIVLGDVDGDGDLDLVEGKETQANSLYLNNGTADPFSGVTASNINDSHWTRSIALGDVDGDGDLDLVAGNKGQTNRLYLNNGSATPFSDVDGSDISSDAQDTRSIALRDVDGDGDLDLVAGNFGQTNRLYLNNSSSDPFNGVVGSDFSNDTHYTSSIVLGNVDGDGDLDLVVGNYQQTNRLYLNNGTADPFNGVSGGRQRGGHHQRCA